MYHCCFQDKLKEIETTVTIPEVFMVVDHEWLSAVSLNVGYKTSCWYLTSEVRSVPRCLKRLDALKALKDGFEKKLAGKNAICTGLVEVDDLTVLLFKGISYIFYQVLIIWDFSFQI